MAPEPVAKAGRAAPVAYSVRWWTTGGAAAARLPLARHPVVTVDSTAALLHHAGCRPIGAGRRAQVMKIPEQGQIQVKVYYEDTDSLGVVYYANYLKYFERGRSELFAAAGTPIAEWNRLGFLVAVYKANVTFHAPARLGDALEVVTRRLGGGSPYRVKLNQQILREGKLLTDAEIHLVCLDEAFELREFPDQMLGEPAD